jgi:hypothetical protein
LNTTEEIHSSFRQVDWPILKLVNLLIVYQLKNELIRFFVGRNKNNYYAGALNARILSSTPFEYNRRNSFFFYEN